MRSLWIARLLVAAALLGTGARAGAAWLDPAAADVDTLLSLGDNQFSWHGGPGNPVEWLSNRGASTSARVKSYQDIAGLRFDLSAYAGREALDAELHVAKADSNPIFALVVSTICAEWSEGTGNGGDAAVGECCWRWRARPADENAPGPGAEWTYPNSDFSSAAFGNFGSLVCYVYRASGTCGEYSAGGKTWMRMKLDPAIVHALALDQFGLAVTDPRGYRTGVYNPRVYTKEQGAALAPRLLVRFAPPAAPNPPAAPGALAVQAGELDGEAIVSFTAPAGAFGYAVRIGDTSEFAAASDVERWRIPRPASPGTAQRMLLENLAPGARRYIFVRAYDKTGAAGPIASAAYDVPPALGIPALPDGDFAAPDPVGKAVRAAAGVLRYWACAETCKVNPATGARMEDGYGGAGSDDYKKANAVWDAGANRVQLSVARNEVAGFQLIVERLGAALSNVRVSASDLAGPGGATIPASTHIEAFQLHYVAKSGIYYPDAAIPLAAPFPKSFAIPDAIHNPGGTNQAVWHDIYVPANAAVGVYTGTLALEADELASPVAIELQLRVEHPVLPDVPSFLVDLNGYGNKWDFGNATLTRLRYFQAAQKHRMSLNTLPYGWRATVDSDRAPALSGAGAALAVSDWSVFDAHYAAFFDGSAFSPTNPLSPYVGPGMNTGVPTFYTPFFESWPIHVLDATHGFDAAGLGGAHWGALIDSDGDAFWTNAPDVRSAFPASYSRGLANIVKAWFEHAQASGWTQTNFQVYLNHKYDYSNCDALWTLEECLTGDDFRAVRFFHEAFRQGAAEAAAPDVRWHWRIDISDRWGQNYGQLNDVINWQVMNGSTSNWHFPALRYRNHSLARPEQWIWYGTGPAPHESGLGHARRFLQAWTQGLDGGVPYWNNFDTNWTQSEPLSLVYSGKNVPGFGQYEGPVMSIRVKTMRQAAQIVELANLLAARPGWNRSRAAASILAKYGDDSPDRSFGGLSENNIYRLRADLLGVLAADASAALAWQDQR